MKYLPNALSASRILLAVAICIASANEQWVMAWWMFAAASLTDVIDGPLARRFNAVSERGRQLDSSADLILVISTFLGLFLGGVVSLATMIGVVIGLVVGLLHGRFQEGEVSNRQFAAGVMALVVITLILGGTLVSLAYGWHWWYLMLAIITLVPIGVIKRGRLQAIETA